MKSILLDGMRGTTIKHVTKDMVVRFTIPVPKTAEKTQQWVEYISEPYNEKNAKRSRVDELETFVQNRIREITTTEECDEVKLGDLCEMIKTGKNKTPDNKKGTLYPYYGTADITGYTNHYLFDGEYVLIARNGTMGNCFIVKGKFYPSDHIFVLTPRDLSIKCLYYFIKTISAEINAKSNGTTIKGISKENLASIEIKLPKNRQLITELEPVFEEIERLQQEIHVADELYQTRIQELANEALPEQPLIINETPVLENTFVEEVANAEEIQDDVASVAESVSTTSENPTKKPRTKKEPKEKVAKEPKPKKETKPRKPRAKKDNDTNEKADK
jgi:restriction endonuclease S subunit